jgi:tRNA pseudouridine55 synthase
MADSFLPVDGVILIDKPAGPTSADVVRQLKARLGTRTRIGHLGTLDPFATGLLPILLGEATKLAPFLQEGTKDYQGLIALGAETDTLDPTGEIVRVAPLPKLDPASLERIAARFMGTIEQTPPVFSAIKRAGVPLYKLARRDASVEPPSPRTVTVERLQLQLETGAEIRFALTCSPGMYVRSLARDIGNALETAAHLRELRRTRSGSFTLTNARPLQDVLAALDRSDREDLISLRDAVAGLPEVMIDQALERRIRNGDARALDNLCPAGAVLFKVISNGNLVALARGTSRVTATLARVFGNG